MSLKSRWTTGRVCPLQVSGICRKLLAAIVASLCSCGSYCSCEFLVDSSSGVILGCAGRFWWSYCLVRMLQTLHLMAKRAVSGGLWLLCTSIAAAFVELTTRHCRSFDLRFSRSLLIVALVIAGASVYLQFVLFCVIYQQEGKIITRHVVVVDGRLVDSVSTVLPDENLAFTLKNLRVDISP